MFRTIEHNADFCVVGGGLAGTIAALAAARSGAKVVLMQDRPMLGGNSSSEIRMWVRGAGGAENREAGILGEFEEENIYRNPTLSPSLWDTVLFGKVKENPNITLLLNTSCLDAETENNRICSVTGWQLTTYTYHRVSAKLFADCSGDSVLAPLSGALHQVGREAKSEFDETIGQEKRDRKTMGMSILLQARETDHAVPFIPPRWANVYPTDDSFAIRGDAGKFATFRDHVIGTDRGNLWWMELGGDEEPLLSTEDMRDELLKVALGVWDHIKNRGDHGYENWELEWVGFLPGKRESFRYIGAHILTEKDITSDRHYPDAVAYGGWPLDDHNPMGIKADENSDPPSRMYPTPSPYQIPFRCLYSANIENLLFAGRNISATHAALSSTRVMGTCSLMGQAVGHAAGICIKYGITPAELTEGKTAELQETILENGGMIPGLRRKIPPVSLHAELNISEKERQILFDGIERPQPWKSTHSISRQIGQSLVFTFDAPTEVHRLRLLFDRDYTRASITPNIKMRVFAMRLHTGLDFVPVKPAETLVKKFTVIADGKTVYTEDNNYNSLVFVPLEGVFRTVEIRFEETRGSSQVNLFGCDIM